jgi:hypothetical protein
MHKCKAKLAPVMLIMPSMKADGKPGLPNE